LSYLDGDGFESFLFPSPSAREQLAVTQAEVAELRRASKDLARQLAEAAREWDSVVAWAHFTATLLESSDKRHSALHNTAIVVVTMVLPAGTDVSDRL
jgi:hypothetical protein